VLTAAPQYPGAAQGNRVRSTSPSTRTAAVSTSVSLSAAARGGRDAVARRVWQTELVLLEGPTWKEAPGARRGRGRAGAGARRTIASGSRAVRDAIRLGTATAVRRCGRVLESEDDVVSDDGKG
jgi:hypothetical protein